VNLPEQNPNKENHMSNIKHTYTKNKTKKEDSIAEIRKLLKEVRVDMGKYSKSLKVGINGRKPINISKQSTRI
jgi:hypothetical protein